MASILEQWKNKNRAQEKNSSTTIEKMPEGVLTPLSHGQEQLWFLQKLYPDNPFYNYCECYIFDGKLDKVIFEKALELVLMDFDILKSIYVSDNKGKIVQKINESLKLDLSLHDISKLSGHELQNEIERIGLADASTLFPLETGPLYKFSMVKCAPEEHRLFLTFNHIITDKWSMMVFRNHLANYYGQLKRNEHPISLRPSIQYADYAYQQKKVGISDKQLDFWKKKLHENIQELPLPYDYERPLSLSFQGSLNTQSYSLNFSQEILSLAKKMEATPYVIVLSAYYILLYKLSAQNNIAIGSPVANRNSKELEDQMGFFNDTIVLQTEVNGQISFNKLVSEVKKTSLEAFANRDVPFNILVKELTPERKLNINPFFQVMFIYHKVPEKPFFGNNLKLRHSPSEVGVAKFDLTLYIAEEDGQIAPTIEYMSDLFKEETIVTFQEYLKTILEKVVENQEMTISEIDLFSPRPDKIASEVTKEKTFGKKPLVDTSKINGIHELIENIAKQSPDSIAITYGNESLSYADLIQRSSAIAKIIVEKTKGENQIIGLCLDRSLDLIVGLLSILRAGSAYLPLDPDYPKQRIDYMLKDAKVNFAITDKNLESFFDANKVESILIPENSDVVSDTILPKVDELDLAYVIYTSGSTGMPKGVPITHKNIINSTQGRLNFYENQPSAFLLLSSIAFDSSKAGLFWTLCSGGNLVISEKRLEQDMHLLAKTIWNNKVSHTLMLPTLYDLILEHAKIEHITSLNTVIVAGEACSKPIVKKHFETLPQTLLYNEYGPTEATVWCIAHKLEHRDLDISIPIGKAVANAQIYLLDENLKIVNKGDSGEIYIGGPGLSKPYINRPDLTKKAFIKSPFTKDDTTKLYKTGDIARQREDGCIEFLGRIDQQVKIRGHRIELDEIENVLNSLPQVKQAIVLIENGEVGPDRNNQSNDTNPQKKIICFVTTNGANVGSSEIVSFLKQKLPNYMLPSSTQVIDKIPLLPNGKTDRNALKNLLKPVKEAKQIALEKPKTVNTLEELLTTIWEDTLHIKPIKKDDNFFEIGGDSITSIQLISKARKSGIMLTANQLFEHQTISGLITFLKMQKEGKIQKYDYLTPLRKEGNKTPLFCIHSGGGHVFFYKLLAEYMKPNRPIYAIHPSGMFMKEKMHRTIPDMAKDYLKAIRDIQPYGPYNILVHCFSTSVGHEMALQLAKTNEKINLIVADNMASPWNATSEEIMKIRRQFFIKRFFSSPYKTIKLFVFNRLHWIEPTLVHLFGKSYQKEIEHLKANLRKMSLEYKNWSTKHNGHVSLLLTEKNDQRFQDWIVNSWKDIALGGVNIVPTKGEHDNLFQEPTVQFVSEKIDECIMEN